MLTGTGVIHHVEVASTASRVGSDQVRFTELEGGTLIINCPPSNSHHILTATTEVSERPSLCKNEDVECTKVRCSALLLTSSDWWRWADC